MWKSLPAVILLAAASAAAQPCRCIPPHPVTIGVNVQQPPALDRARAANLGWIRMDFRWSELEPARGQWTFARHDRDLRAAHELGLKVLAILYHTPEWAGGGRSNNVPATDLRSWEEYVRRVVERYDGSDPSMRIDAYEIWNEPDLTDGGDGVGWNYPIHAYPRYVDYVQSAGALIRERGNGAKVVAGAYSAGDDEAGPSTMRIRAIATQLQQASDVIDVISLHANGRRREYSDRTTDRAKFRIDDHNAYNPANACKPKWITEFGFASALVGEASQRDRIRRMIEMFAGSHKSEHCTGWTRGTHFVEKVFIYVQLDFDDLTRGIHRADGSAKAVVTQYLRTLPFPASDY